MRKWRVKQHTSTIVILFFKYPFTCTFTLFMLTNILTPKHFINWFYFIRVFKILVLFWFVLVSIPSSVEKRAFNAKKDKRCQQILPFITHITFLNKNAPLNSSCIDILQYQFRKRIMKQTSNKNKFFFFLNKEHYRTNII